MERLFLIFLIYIIFAVIGPLLRRSQQRQKVQQKESASPKKPERQQIKDVQAKFGKYFNQLQETFKQPAPPKLPEDEQQASKLLAVPSKPEQHDQDELVEFFPPPLSASQMRAQSRASRRPKSVRHKKPPSLLGFDRRRGYLQGIILSEILGPPVSKRSRGHRL
jgi:hypothetical protein